MAEYIDREKVTELIDYYQEDYFEVEAYFGLLKEDFLQLPSADVQPVVHGEWTAEGNDVYGNYWDECTACRKSVWFPPFVKNDYKYCPHCGAVMDA